MKPLLLLLFVVLTSCATKEEKATPSVMSQPMANRLTRPDLTKRSIYDKSMQASLNQKTNSGAWFGRQKAHTNMFSGTKTFGHTPDFKTSAFSGGSTKSHMGSQTFQQAGKVSSDADAIFATSGSRFAKRTSPDATKTFSGADDTFATTANKAALKSQEKNKRPTFIQLDDKSRSPAYSEDQVRKLMGRD
ncbi:MAG: hypothetical protein U0984_11200 [Prosthecobacter sp.]|nr:hypothetical protein [Prosthecobacter sp.]